MPWYYLDQNRQQVPIEKEGLKNLYRAGAVTKDTLVWTESMTDWIPLSKAMPDLEPPAAAGTALATGGSGGGGGALTNPYAAPQVKQSTASGRVDVREVTALIGGNAGWIKFLGVMAIISGVFSIIMLPVAIIYIWMGVVLLQAGTAFKAASVDGTPESLTEALSKTNLFFKATAITMLISFGLMIVMILFFIIFSIVVGVSGVEGMESSPNTF